MDSKFISSLPTKTDHAYQNIRRQILSGELPPTMPLDQEAIAAALGLSTTPVREALRRLESERLVITRAHRDTVVAPLSLTMVEEVYAVRLSLDPLAVAFAASRLSSAESERLLAVAQQQPHPSADKMAHLQHNRGLHREMYASCGNETLIEVLDGLWDMTDRYRMITLQDDDTVQSAQEEHGAIVRAVASNDPALAAELMREHVAESLRRIRGAGGHNAGG
jgi:DNA-binding GntR family transcriptional regulator